MKGLLLISFFYIILFSVIISAKCGDDFCDPDEDCKNCRFDCLCEGFKCCVKPACMECETSYCYSTCSSERTYWILENVRCDDDRVISFRLGVNPFSTFTWNRIRLSDTYVYLKMNDTEKSFSKVKGKFYWEGEELHEEDVYSLIGKKILFISEEVVDRNGVYIIRLKSRLGFRTSYFTEKGVKCLNIKEDESKIEKKRDLVSESEKKVVTEESEKKGLFKRIVDYILSKIFSS